ncbi:MAG: hypothetical protein RL095_2933, partial [Verrucomicrobiota bacterium]
MADEMQQMYVEESLEHLATIEADLLRLEAEGLSPDLVNKVFRAFHTVKGGAGFFKLDQVRSLAHEAESLLDRFRAGSLAPSPTSIQALLRAGDLLCVLLQNPDNTPAACGELIATLQTCLGKPPDQAAPPPSAPAGLDFRFAAASLARAPQGPSLYHLRLAAGDDAREAELAQIGSILEAHDTAAHRQVLFSSVIEPELAAEFFGLPAADIVFLKDRQYPAPAANPPAPAANPPAPAANPPAPAANPPAPAA